MFPWATAIGGRDDATPELSCGFVTTKLNVTSHNPNRNFYPHALKCRMPTGPACYCVADLGRNRMKLRIRDGMLMRLHPMLSHTL